MYALAFNRAVNLWFLVDVCLNFVTGYVDRKTGCWSCPKEE